ncbi:MAG: acyl-ACP--UDP-N-acetylglucosamine O-acyltransferase, partial [Cyanobacteria bacterium]|nr:acyl-ACP--UDP-N-acetylglucosamine O-acyltransferase [Cyanobacteriota bacterium]
MSSPLIHPTAVLDASVELGQDVEIGAYSVIGPHTRIGNGCKIDAHVVIKGYTTLGDFCKISSWAVIGGDPQHMQCTSSPSWVEIGDKVVIREYVTIHRSNNPIPDIENQKTVIGNQTLIMAYSHIAHDCILGERVILANQVQLAGHVIIENDAFLGGRVMVHQFVRIGDMAMIGANAIVLQDVPPFALSAHSPAEVYGINSVGLKRHGV